MWSAFTLAFQLTVGRTMNELRRRTGLPPDHDGWRGIHAHHVLLAQDTAMGDLPRDAKGQVTQVPAFVPRRQDAAPLSDLLERFLRGAGTGSADASPVVYIGFGSMPSVDRKRVETTARELWELHGARVILQSMYAEDAAQALPEGVFAVNDVDHVSLFPRVDLIVHHGGAGTTAAALRSGVPQLVVPHVLDQFFHGRRIAELGVGPEPVPKAKLSAAAIAAALKDRFKYWAKAQSVRASITADGGAPEAAQYLERLVRSGAR
jgi:vancomycin aglycone glucosyltransferase